MQKTTFLDVEVPIEQGELLDALTSTQAKNRLSAEIIEKHRVKAEEEARAVGGRLQTDTMPEWYIRRGSDLVNGGDYILTASRWTVLVPNSFDPKFAAARSR